ncbi:S1-C subfamily serine protease [Paenibacillus phyllosphaerae]|uniref:S1-C subfamily serine protease n=1 Tax=Paenibacillus phyllosphaerae TaxID=274593 RepID=A0A7W5B3V5_9BACL|nr:serine protease [Paenibacillus phyllosphaerae]MBB3113917.1 S1-C subfamily serine protease [Paenibacillus phyllosphaerae]
MRRFMLASMALLITGCILLYPKVEADVPGPYNAEQTFEQAEDAVFYLRSLRTDGTVAAVGTGVVMDAKGKAATAYHVVENAATMEAVFEDGRTVKGVKLLSYDKLTDAALIELPASGAGSSAGYAYLPVRTDALRPGVDVFAIGYPLKNTVIITEGIVNNPSAEINGRDRILTSAEIVSGMSGGPLIDEKGQLAGIISGSLRTMDNIHLVIDMEDVLSLQTSGKK